MKNQRTHRKQFGATIMELMVTVALTAFIVAIVIPSMIFIARAMKGFRTDMNYQQQLTDFYQRVSLERSRSYEIAINTLGQVEMTGYTSTFEEDEESTTGFTYVQNTVVSRLIYFDVDGEPDTIEDNTLEMVTVESNKAGNVVRTSTKTLLTDVSPLWLTETKMGLWKSCLFLKRYPLMAEQLYKSTSVLETELGPHNLNGINGQGQVIRAMCSNIF